MFQLHEDPNFHYEAIRSLGLTPYLGGDVGEQLSILPSIRPGNVEDWYHAWNALAKRVLSTVSSSESNTSYTDVTLRDAYLRASHYFFVADFFLHGNVNDPRLDENFQLWRKYFDAGNAKLETPGVHYSVKADGFDVPMIVYRAPGASETSPKPTMLIAGGFDSNYEECLHVFGYPALERGYNVILYEGPGQPRLLHEQQKGFIAEWEKVVNPIMDFIEAQSKGKLAFVDVSKIALVGMSLGGYLAARAAAFEPRLAAVMCIDGVWSFHECCLKVFPDAVQAYESGNVEAFNAAVENTNEHSSTNRRWFHDHLKFSFRKETAWEVFEVTKKMALDGVAGKIKMPAFIGEAEGDIFFGDQPARVAAGIGPHATLVKFGADQAASEHCQSGANRYLTARMYDWFEDTVLKGSK